jgi:uncharacterized protein (TIGR00369 family)
VTPDEIAGAVAEISDMIPFNHHLGIRVDAFGSDGVVVHFEKRPELIGNFARGILHGGVISSTLDLVGGLTALGAVLANERPSDMEEVGRIFSRFGTIDLRVDYLRPAGAERYEATGTALRIGRRVAVTRMELTGDDGVVVAVGTGTYITG